VGFGNKTDLPEVTFQIDCPYGWDALLDTDFWPGEAAIRGGINENQINSSSGIFMLETNSPLEVVLENGFSSPLTLYTRVSTGSLGEPQINSIGWIN
jgi:hypothetical protein